MFAAAATEISKHETEEIAEVATDLNGLPRSKKDVGLLQVHPHSHGKPISTTANVTFLQGIVSCKYVIDNHSKYLGI